MIPNPRRSLGRRRKRDSDKRASKASSKEPGKPPPGFEESFNKDNKSSPLTGPSGGSSDGKEAQAAGFAALTEEEIKQVTDIAKTIKNGLPKSQADVVDLAVDLIKKGGIPSSYEKYLMNKRPTQTNGLISPPLLS